MANVTDYCAAGTRLTWVGHFDFSLSGDSPGNVISNVSNDLNTNQGITVENSSYQGGLLKAIQGAGIDVTLALLVTGDHAHVDDVRQIVDHSFYVVLGNLPASSRITDVTTPDATGPDPTGAAPAPPANPGDDSTCSASNLAACLPGSGTVALIAGIVVVGLLAIAYTASRV